MPSVAFLAVLTLHLRRKKKLILSPSISPKEFSEKRLSEAQVRIPFKSTEIKEKPLSKEMFLSFDPILSSVTQPS